MRFDHKAMADQFVLLNMGLCNFYVKTAEECNGKWGAYIKVGLKLQEVGCSLVLMLSDSNQRLEEKKFYVSKNGTEIAITLLDRHGNKQSFKMSPEEIKERPESAQEMIHMKDKYLPIVLEATLKRGYTQEVAPPQNTAETSVLLSASNTALWKLKQFLEAIGRGRDFESDNLDASTLVKAQGQCMVGHKEFVSNKDGKILVGLDIAHFDKDGKVPELITLSDAAPKNAPAQTTGTTQAQAQQQQPAKQEFDDDVPF